MACDFTDDSVLTIGVADAILHKKPYQEVRLHENGQRNTPRAGYGAKVIKWTNNDKAGPYNS